MALQVGVRTSWSMHRWAYSHLNSRLHRQRDRLLHRGLRLFFRLTISLVSMLIIVLRLMSVENGFFLILLFFNFCYFSFLIFFVMLHMDLTFDISDHSDLMSAVIISNVFMRVNAGSRLMIGPLINFMRFAFVHPPLLLVSILILIFVLDTLVGFFIMCLLVGWLLNFSIRINVVMLFWRIGLIIILGHRGRLDLGRSRVPRTSRSWSNSQ